MEAYVFRHGDTLYNQGNVAISLSQADDLTDKGVITVNESTIHLSVRFNNKKPICIHSSRTGRCLHSSRLINETLSGRGYNVLGIEEDSLIGEVANFEWALFVPLVLGGEIVYEGERFQVNPSLTNPRGLIPIRYFREDSAHSLSTPAKNSMPARYLERVASFEKYPLVANRLDQKLKALGNDDEKVHILCTHEGLTGRYIEQISGIPGAYLGRGKYFSVKTEGGILIPHLYQEDAFLID